MKIGIISDSHDHHQNVNLAVDIFNAYKVEYVLHAGDIISPFTAKAFGNIKAAKFIAVFGNNDGEKLFLTNTINRFGGEIYENCLKTTIADCRIYMTHVHNNIEEIAKSQMYDLVIYGHTHLQDIRRVEKSLIINPGESTDWITAKPTLVILDLKDMNYETVSLG